VQHDRELQRKRLQRASEVGDAYRGRGGRGSSGVEDDGLLGLGVGGDGAVREGLGVDLEGEGGGVVERDGEAGDGGGGAVREVDDQAAHGPAVFGAESDLQLGVFVEDAFVGGEEAAVARLPVRAEVYGGGEVGVFAGGGGTEVEAFEVGVAVGFGAGGAVGEGFDGGEGVVGGSDGAFLLGAGAGGLGEEDFLGVGVGVFAADDPSTFIRAIGMFAM